MGGGQGMRGNAAGQRGIIVNVEFEEVEEGIVNRFEGAIDVWDHQQDVCTLDTGRGHAFLNAKVKLEGSPRLVACHERDILQPALIICDLPESVPG